MFINVIKFILVNIEMLIKIKTNNNNNKLELTTSNFSIRILYQMCI